LFSEDVLICFSTNKMLLMDTVPLILYEISLVSSLSFFQLDFHCLNFDVCPPEGLPPFDTKSTTSLLQY